jgi:ubiquinone/menaquinone biosynthesis C-methylase UbiE
MDCIDINKNWDDMANEYELFTNDGESYSNLIEWKAIKSILPDLKDKNIIDLGCGTGRFSFLFENMNPENIIGIDLSQKMIEIGLNNAKIKKSIVKFIHGNIEDLIEIKSESIDFVFSSTTLHYIKDLNNIMKQINRILVVGGTCILSVIHPVYSACYPILHESRVFPNDDEWQIKYLDNRDRGYVQPWIEYNTNVDNFLSFSYHHTMSDYINSMNKAGLQIKKLLEPLPPNNWRDNNPERYYGFINTPTYAIFKIEKTI